MANNETAQYIQERSGPHKDIVRVVALLALVFCCSASVAAYAVYQIFSQVGQ